ncbi:MAG: hypothetical protein QOD04_1843, partial [Pseudonocardiales bacterium]|nr:hypothetical protein [Pseudonocardiales bacterium]
MHTTTSSGSAATSAVHTSPLPAGEVVLDALRAQV